MKKSNQLKAGSKNNAQNADNQENARKVEPTTPTLPTIPDDAREGETSVNEVVEEPLS